MEKRDYDASLEAMRHSLAHITAAAIKRIWPKAKFGVGPVVDNGFYYDIDLGADTISNEDFSRIEAEMKKIIAENQPFDRSELTIDEAIKWARNNDQPYKEELLNDLKREGTTLARELDVTMMGLPAGISGVSEPRVEIGKVSFYKNGDFIDLCRGPHLKFTGEAGAFKLTKIAGAYWRGDEKKAQMQRLYGVAFKTEKELRKYLNLLEEAKKRDHRKLGRELDLFAFSDLVGSGLPLFTPRGTVLRQGLLDFSEELQQSNGYQKVFIPHITKEDLYKRSGHWDKFGDELFLVQSQETNDKFVLKPMNCPHHIQIYSSKPRSYKELPIKYMESTVQYRDEKSGELHGLSRVRAISIDDSHVFCMENDIEKEIVLVIQMIKDLYKTLDMEFYARLSYRDDSEGYLGDQELWSTAEGILAKVARQEKLKFIEERGEAAFYGPKIDFMVKDSLEREWQCATIQLDFVQPERFNLAYTTPDGSEKRPVMIHKALLGSIERFLSVYIEHTAGKFPIWLAPEQIRLITVNQEKETTGFADKILALANDLGLRASVDNDNESVGKKIRNAELAKIPYSVVIGDKEVKSGKVTPRVRTDIEVSPDHKAHNIQDFLQTVRNEAKSRVLKTSL
ncbi:MAG TPA: threonine--tRNA ligase [Patescibacteria group bacterium]|nr:threonine--tRNA ligase [Patescibacteria group bacterium]